MLNIPPTLYDFLNRMAGKFLNWAFIRYWELRGAIFRLTDAPTMQNIYNTKGTALSTFGFEVRWLMESGTWTSGRVFW